MSSQRKLEVGKITFPWFFQLRACAVSLIYLMSPMRSESRDEDRTWSQINRLSLINFGLLSKNMVVDHKSLNGERTFQNVLAEVLLPQVLNLTTFSSHLLFSSKNKDSPFPIS